MSEIKQVTRSGFGRVLIALYAVFALAASARSVVQLITAFNRAPLAYLLSALAAVIYIVATVSFIRASSGSRKVAAISCVVEFAGVVIIGTVSLLFPSAFPDATVWSVYGNGYYFIPVILPLLGLFWIFYTARSMRDQP